MAKLVLFVILFTFIFVRIINGYKVLMFVPGLSNSQLMFNYRLADLLHSKGHEVTLLVIEYNPLTSILPPKGPKVLNVKALNDTELFAQHSSGWDKTIFASDETLMDTIRDFSNFFEFVFVKACENIVANDALFEQLRMENFDLAIAHNYDLCPIGLIHALKIPSFIWVSSGVFMDHIAWAVGATAPSSFVPQFLSTYSDRMSFVQRTQNFFGSILFQILYDYILVQPEWLVFRRRFGDNFPNLNHLAGKAPLVFVNSEEFVDFPRPTLHKVVYVGGIDMNVAKPLQPEWQRIADESDLGFFILSFGSVANSSAMTEQWRMSFVNAFSQFPRYTFIWKFELGVVPEALNHKNIIVTKWAPQKDLLSHPKIAGLITHCGYNSFIEAAVNAVPIVAIPLFADQMSNRKRGERLGTTVGIDKLTLNVEKLTNAIGAILQNRSYKENAKKLAHVLATKPIKSSDLAVRWVEYLAEFKQLPNLEPASTDMNLIEYFMLDVFATLVITIVFACYVLFCTLRYTVRRIFFPHKFVHKRNRLGYSYSSD